MDAGLQRREPEDHAGHEVRRPTPQRPEPQQRDDGDEDPGGREEPRQREAVRVEDRDHGDGADVVDDGERQQEHANARRHARAKQREGAEDERDVGRHHDAPAVRARAASVEGRVDQCRPDHARERSDRGHRRGTPVAQLSERELTPDLEADDVEEPRHQAVVHPVLEIEVDRADAAERDRELRVPELEVALRPPGVRPDERDERRGEQEPGAARLGGEELTDRSRLPHRPGGARRGGLRHGRAARVA